MIILRLKKIIEKLFSIDGGRSGYPSNFLPKNIPNPKNLPIVFDIKPLKSFEEDLGKHIVSKNLIKSKIKELVLSLGRGYVFKNNPENSKEYTHSLGKFGSMDILSKDINISDRFIYGVKITTAVIGGVLSLYVVIRLISNYGHKDKFDLEKIGKKK